MTSGEYFFDQLEHAQNSLASEGIDYRIVGSVAAAAHVQSTLVFDRPDNRQAYSIPDIDMIVPRNQLDVARCIRDELYCKGEGVRLGLAFPSQTIDWRPNEKHSYLTFTKDIRQPILSTLFDRVDGNISGVPVVTVSPATLLHTYVVNGGTLRSKDLPAIRALVRKNRDSNQIPEELFNGFHDFIRARQSTPYYSEKQLILRGLKNFPLAARTGKRLASLFGMR